MPSGGDKFCEKISIEWEVGMTVVVDNRGRCKLLFRFGGQGSLTTDMLSQRH